MALTPGQREEEERMEEKMRLKSLLPGFLNVEFIVSTVSGAEREKQSKAQKFKYLLESGFLLAPIPAPTTIFLL